MSDTIAAISTARGESAIAIVRLSGPKAFPIAQKLFRPKRGSGAFRSHHLSYGHIVNPQGAVLDEVLMALMQRPQTYTREDMVEINTHGGSLAAQRILDLLLEAGARLAEPGEFTKRAFLNGRIDLTQAAAVIDLIRAKSAVALATALEQLAGKTRTLMAALKADLVALAAEVEAVLNFPDDDIVRTDGKKAWISRIDRLRETVMALEAKVQQGQVVREGVRVVIAGPPNAGKSTLFNALLGRPRAIVTDIPGTTRDAIEEGIQIKGFLFTLADTAGLVESTTLLEAAMAAKTREYLDKSDLVLLVMDSSLPDPVIPDGLAELKAKRIIPVANKADISHPRGLKTIQQRFPGTPVVRVSALTGAGLEQLTDTLYQAYFTGPAITPADIVYATAEQQQFIRQLRGELEGLQGSVSQGEPAELWAEHLGQAIRLVAAFTGEELAPAVLERLFAQFCIGK